MGRLLPGGAKGPGIFFILPCIDNYVKVDLRTISFDVPPQEVSRPRPFPDPARSPTPDSARSPTPDP